MHQHNANGPGPYEPTDEDWRTWGEDRAEAKRLADAAPGLLAACETLMEFWDNGSPVHPGAEVVEDVRDAIRRATGKS